MKKLLATLSAAALLVGTIGFAGGTPLALAEETEEGGAAAGTEGTAAASEDTSYRAYLLTYADAPRPTQPIPVDLSSMAETAGQVELKEEYEGRPGASVYLGDDAGAQWTVNVEEEGLYAVRLAYYPVEGKGVNIERRLLLNGELPFAEAQSLTFSRYWKDESEIRTDSQNNQIRPDSYEEPRWMEKACSDSSGYVDDPLLFYFHKGENTIRLESVREPMVLGGITLYNAEELPAYEQVLKEYGQAGYEAADGGVRFEAEKVTAKSETGIYAEADRGSPGMSPVSCETLILNKLSANWQVPGQWVTWDFEVKESGLYKFTVRYKQASKDGAFCSRRVKIDGEVLYEELDQVRFEYAPDWKIKTLSTPEGEELLVYLEAGTHTLEMEAVVGDMADIVSRTQEELTALNRIYRSIIMVTGTTPDVHRDYEFESLIPDVIEEMKVRSANLKELETLLTEAAGKGSSTASFEKLTFDLDAMTQTPREISSRLENFKSNLGSLGTWLSDTVKQPVEFDWIEVQGADQPLPEVKTGFFASLWHQVRIFLSSFMDTYTNPALGSAKSIKVWLGNGVTGGRDQSQIIKRMADQEFTPQTGIGVNFELVASGTLLPATLSGTGPDVALQVANTDPMNYALRGATVDLSAFEGFEEVASRFNESALLPYTYRGQVFGLPDTYTFPMMFVRTDIFEELGLEPPETWDDVYEIIVTLGMNNMQFGFSTIGTTPDISAFAMLLYQHGGEFYTEDGRASALDSQTALETFQEWTQFYLSYDTPVQHDFANRFRTGEMPIAVVDLAQYNQLSVFAPEIKGLWKIYPVPGTKKEDGSVDHSAASTGTACVIMKDSEVQDEAWEFLRWWTQTDTQSSYARELENVLGIAARHFTANKEAVEQISWNHEEYNSLMSQWEYLKGIPECPGSYIMPRYVDFAFKAVVNEKRDAGQQLLQYVSQINDEIDRKRKEFGVDDE